MGIQITEDHWSQLLGNAQNILIQDIDLLTSNTFTGFITHLRESVISRRMFLYSVHDAKSRLEIYYTRWTCPKLACWTSEIEDILKVTLNMEFCLSPSTALLGDLSKLKFTSSCSANFFSLAITAAKKCVTLAWKKEEAPSVTHWINELSSCMPLEKITFNLKGSPHLFLKTWQPWISYLETR